MLTFRIGRIYFQSWNIYIVNVRVCTEDQLSQKKKIKNIKEKYNKIVGILWKMSELLVKTGV